MRLPGPAQVCATTFAFLYLSWLQCFAVAITVVENGPLPMPTKTKAPTGTHLLAECRSCRQFCRVMRRRAAGPKKLLAFLEEGKGRSSSASFEEGCDKACKQEPDCPFMIDRMPPTPYPPPPPPSRPHPLWAGDLRVKGLVLGMPTPTPPGPPPPPLPALPVAPIPNWQEKVGLRFLPRVPMPKGEVSEKQDLDYDGNPIPRASAAAGSSLLSMGVLGVPGRLISFGEESDED